jgi:hypothetical protein
MIRLRDRRTASRFNSVAQRSGLAAADPKRVGGALCFACHRPVPAAATRTELVCPCGCLVRIPARAELRAAALAAVVGGVR